MSETEANKETMYAELKADPQTANMTREQFEHFYLRLQEFRKETEHFKTELYRVVENFEKVCKNHKHDQFISISEIQKIVSTFSHNVVTECSSILKDVHKHRMGESNLKIEQLMGKKAH